MYAICTYAQVLLQPTKHIMYIYICCSIGGLLVFQCVQVDVSYSLESWYAAAFCSLKRRTFPPSRCFTSPGDVDCIAMSSLIDLVQDFVSAGELSNSKVTAIGTRNAAGDVTDLGRLHSTAEEDPEADPCGVSIYSVEEEWKRVMAPAIEEHGDQVTQCGTEVEQVVTNLKVKIDQCIETGKTEDTDEKEERREGNMVHKIHQTLFNCLSYCHPFLVAQILNMCLQCLF